MIKCIEIQVGVGRKKMLKKGATFYRGYALSQFLNFLNMLVVSVFRMTSQDFGARNVSIVQCIWYISRK